MQIVLVGAQSTGKTSVMNALPDEFKRYGIREVIRNMTAQDPTVQKQYLVIRCIPRREVLHGRSVKTRPAGCMRIYIVALPYR